MGVQLTPQESSLIAGVADAILPLFGILLVGYISGWAGLLAESASETLNSFVFYVSFPALIFVSMARLSPADFFNWPFIWTLTGGMGAMFAASFLMGGRVFRHRRGEAALHALTSMFPSTAYIGLPLLMLLFGDVAIGPGVFGAVVTVAVFLPIALFLIETETGTSWRGFGSALFKVLRSPIVIAIAAGLSVSASGLHLPKALASLCDLLGAAFAPCALFSAGLFIVKCSVRGAHREVAWLTGAKLVLHPAITWAIGAWVFGLEGLLLTVAVLLAALPTGVPVFVLAQQVQRFTDRSAAVVVISTALSVGTLLIIGGLLGR